MGEIILGDKVIFILLDAFRNDYIEEASTPLIYSKTKAGVYAKKLKSTPGFTQRTAIFSGTNGIENGMFTMFNFDKKNSPYRKLKRNFIVNYFSKPTHVWNLLPHECLSSIKNQIFKDFETIIVDGGSTDGSRDICERFCREDNRFKLITQKNQGPASARNTGLAYSAGEYIMFVDSDDNICPNTANDLLPIMDRYHLDVLSFNFTTCKSQGFSQNYI